MTDRVAPPTLTLSIAAVERDTGLSKDTLRVWERRYGFPQPARDTGGERQYPIDQVEKLRLLKRLLDAGHRPGKLVPMPARELARLAESTVDKPAPRAGAAPELEPFVQLLRAHDVEELRRQLGQALSRMGLGRFVTELVAPLNTQVGEAWMRGQLEIFEEHLYTESMNVVLRDAIRSVPASARADRPRVLLTTVPGEPHALGLLMAEALLAMDGARCVSLGAQTPVWDIVLAATAQRSDIVALSFTGCMNPNHVQDALAELREKLPAGTELWAGGAAPVLARKPTPGVVHLPALARVNDELQRWRTGAQPGPGNARSARQTATAGR
jgi:MerR family transcriptional regulator, light-induced transcriptional regulator